MVVGGEAQGVPARDLGALTAAAAEDPHLHVGPFSGDGVGFQAFGRSVVAPQESEDVANLFAVVLGLGVGQKRHRSLQPHPRGSQQGLDRELLRDQQAVGGDTVGRGPGRSQAPGRRGAGRPARRATLGPAQTQIESSRIGGVEQAELLHDRQSGSMPQLHATRADPDAGSG